PQQCERRRLNLIDRLSAVGWPVWVVWVAEQQSSLYKKLYGIVSNCFAGVRCVANSISFSDEINDRRDAAQGCLCIFPRNIWTKIKQRKQSVGGSLVPLPWPKLQRGKDFASLSESLFSGFV